MILRSCIRIAAVLALRNSTWAKACVYDSNNAPLETAVQDAAAPFLTVFTDSDKRMLNGRDIAIAERELQVVVEIGIANRIEAVDEGGPVVAVPSSDDAFERALDVIEHQVLSALVMDPANEWGEFFKQFVTSVKSVTSERAGEAERGTRWAARGVTLTVDTISDPVPGEVLAADHPVARFLARLAGHEDVGLATVAELLRSALSVTNAMSWEQAAAVLGLARDEANKLGIEEPFTDTTIPESEPDDPNSLPAVEVE